MKPVEDAFASDTFRRVILPGIVLAIGIHPLIANWVHILDRLYGIGATPMLVAEVIFFGLVVSSAINWIYYVYEGFRLAPLTALAHHINRRRVKKLMEVRRELQALKDRTPSQQNKFYQAYEGLRDFPVRKRPDGKIEYFAERPTVLGNIIAVYELYAQTRYGFDGVDYWSHLLSFASPEARKEFSDQYAFAESLVLTSFSGALVTILYVFLLIGFAIGKFFPGLAVVTVQAGPAAAVALLAFGIVVWIVFYEAALPAHREAGRTLKSVIDTSVPEFLVWLSKVRAPLDEATVEKLEKLRRYLAEPNSHNAV
jgi:hypothetical protein